MVPLASEPANDAALLMVPSAVPIAVMPVKGLDTPYEDNIDVAAEIADDPMREDAEDAEDELDELLEVELDFVDGCPANGSWVTSRLTIVLSVVGELDDESISGALVGVGTSAGAGSTLGAVAPPGLS